MSAPAFRVALDYDRRAASNGVSRYHVYAAKLFIDVEDAECLRDPVSLAAGAWHRATGPVMSPPYVVAAPPILRARVLPDDGDEGTLLMSVEVATGIPDELRAAFAGWRSWRLDIDGSPEAPADLRPGRIAVLPRHELLLPIGRDVLYVPPGRPGVVDAAAAVACLVTVLNPLVGPVLDEVVRRWPR